MIVVLNIAVGSDTVDCTSARTFADSVTTQRVCVKNFLWVELHGNCTDARVWKLRALWMSVIIISTVSVKVHRIYICLQKCNLLWWH